VSTSRWPGALLASALILAGAAAGCASGSKGPSPRSSSSRGSHALEAVVVEREYEPPGTGSASLRSSGAWYLGFEARDGEKTVHYRFPVTREQYNRYPEGTRVRLIVNDDRLREIRPLLDSR
jgi:hypothetical protein